MSTYQTAKAQPSPKGFDINQVISADQAQWFYQKGYRFCLRYLSRQKVQQAHDLQTQEVQDILNAGLALMAVQHVEQAGWEPYGALGQEYGTNAANHAQALGLSKGINIWLDLEGINPTFHHNMQAIVDYCQAWYTAVNNAGYSPGLYVGYNNFLDSATLYKRLSFQHYWRSNSNVEGVDHRGYQVVQRLASKVNINGNILKIDENYAQYDYKGDSVIWMTA
ncbi:MAG: DUF1906 domain-containing protein [Bacteroidota bacterium]